MGQISPADGLPHPLKCQYHVIGVSTVEEVLIGREGNKSQNYNRESKFTHRFFRSACEYQLLNNFGRPACTWAISSNENLIAFRLHWEQSPMAP